MPQPFTINFEEKGKFTVWELFSTSVREIIDHQSFHGIELLIPGDRGRVTRSGIAYGYDRDAFQSLANERFDKYAKYLDGLLLSLEDRFEPWPHWLTQSDIAFNFKNNIDLETRKKALQDLMECPFGPAPLVQEEKQRILAEYVTFFLNVQTLVEPENDPETFSHSALWYQLLTNPTFFEHCKRFNAFALRLLNRSFNEGVVEVEVSSPARKQIY